MDHSEASIKYRTTAEDRAWRRWRVGYYALQFLLFLGIGFRLGPNLILFQSPFSPGMAEYVRLTEPFVPIISAIKAYQRDFGNLPGDSSSLPPAYVPANSSFVEGEINDTTSITFAAGDHGVIEYEFSPGKEGWIGHFPRYDGAIAAPIVSAAPKPATRPSAGATANSPHGN